MSLSTRYITAFLETNDTVTLEKIGTLFLPKSPVKDEEGNLIEQPIFVYNKKAETTPAFIDYLAEATKKSHSIAQSDLEYFLDQSRQLMNIGSNPLVLEGLGAIYAERNGAYAFRTSDVQESGDREKKPLEDNYNNSPLTSATNYATRRPNNRVIGRWVLILIIIGIIIYGAYFIPKSSFKFFSDSPAKPVDTVAKTVEPLKKTVEVARQQKKPGEYRFIFQTFTSAADADKRLRQLKNYGNIVSIDSTTEAGQTVYKLYIQMDSVAVTDTTRVKDSLRSYYGHPVTIE